LIADGRVHVFDGAMGTRRALEFFGT